LFAAEFLTPAAVIEDLLPSRVDFRKLDELSRTWGCRSSPWLVYRSHELGLVSDASARRAYQRLNQLTNIGLFEPQKVTSYPGEMASLLAFDPAQEHNLVTLAALARELHWKIPACGYSSARSTNAPHRDWSR
jgi:hypothetical protein